MVKKYWSRIDSEDFWKTFTWGGFPKKNATKNWSPLVESETLDVILSHSVHSSEREKNNPVTILFQMTNSKPR